MRKAPNRCFFTYLIWGESGNRTLVFWSTVRRSTTELQSPLNWRCVRDSNSRNPYWNSLAFQASAINRSANTPWNFKFGALWETRTLKTFRPVVPKTTVYTIPPKEHIAFFKLGGGWEIRTLGAFKPYSFQD